MDIETLSRQIIDFEKRNDVFNKHVKGIYFWPLIRFDMFQALASEKNMFGDAHPHLKNRNKWTSLFGTIGDVIKRNPFQGKTPLDFIIIPHTRRVKGQDIYSKDIYGLIKNNPHMILYNRAHDHIEHDAKTMEWQSLIYSLGNIFFNKTGILPYRLDNLDNQIITAISQEFRSEFLSSIALEKMIKRHILRFNVFYKAYKKLLQQTSPRFILMLTAYSNMPIIAAARDLGIHTYEIQHGTITENHMGYYYPHCDTPPYFPETLLCHGDFWAQKPPLPQGVKTRVIGASHISAILSNKPKIKNQVLFFSQGTVAKELYPLAIKIAQSAPDYHFIYRLHPSEIRSDYNDPNINNFEIRHGADGFFDDLTQSEFIATVYSTTIYEAAACGAKAIVIGLNGHNAIQGIIDNGDAIMAKTPDDFITALSNAKPCDRPEKYYAEFKAENLRELVGKTSSA